jgi:hypothetical protein
MKKDRREMEDDRRFFSNHSGIKKYRFI